MVINKNRVRVAFQGIKGAYSHMASEECFPKGIKIPCVSFEEMLDKTKIGLADYAMVPVENSVAGRVADIHNLIPESGLFIIAEHFQKVNHQLLGLEGASFNQIKYVKSHAQGIAQCRNLIKKLKLKPIQHVDTAGAAYDVANENDISVAAIASKMAGEIYGLKVLKENIADASHNTTRFLIMSSKMLVPNIKIKKTVTSIIFEVKSVPAALYKVLGGFATNGINLTKLESYLGGKNMYSAKFFVDAESHPNSVQMKNALDEMKFYTMPKSIKILGSYPRNK